LGEGGLLEVKLVVLLEVENNTPPPIIYIYIFPQHLKIIPIHKFDVRKLYLFIYYSVISDPFIYQTKFQNKTTVCHDKSG
jgi:hypothetical protein